MRLGNETRLMNQIHTILIADDDDGHAFLIEDNLRRGGVKTEFLRFSDGQEVLDYFFAKTGEPSFDPEKGCLLLLDIRMPKVDGVAVLREIKAHAALRSLPVIMLTTTEDPREVDRCHQLGCNIYMHKPVSFESFADAITQIGKLVNLAQIPRLKREG
jgi:CheY-like chemotaxis protein